MAAVWQLVVLAVVWCVGLVLSSKDTATELKRFTPKENTELSNLVYYNGILYVGGRDFLYSFDEELKKKQTVDTCTKSCKSNYNQVLLLNKTTQEMIVCGTGNDGFCDRRSLMDLSNVTYTPSKENRDWNTMVVSTDVERPALAMMWDDNLFLMAVTYGANILHNINTDKHEYNALTLRHNSFVFNDVGNTGGSKLLIKIKTTVSSLSNYVVYYKDVFRDDIYTYLLTNQKKYVGNDTYVSKIVQLCNYDPTFKTYVDMELTCVKDGVTYNLVQDSTVGKINGEDHLIASFAKGNEPENVNGGGVVCSEKISELNRQLTNEAFKFLKSPFLTDSEQYLSLTSSYAFPVSYYIIEQFFSSPEH